MAGDGEAVESRASREEGVGRWGLRFRGGVGVHLPLRAKWLGDMKGRSFEEQEEDSVLEHVAEEARG